MGSDGELYPASPTHPTHPQLTHFWVSFFVVVDSDLGELTQLTQIALKIKKPFY